MAHDDRHSFHLALARLEPQLASAAQFYALAFYRDEIRGSFRHRRPTAGSRCAVAVRVGETKYDPAWQRARLSTGRQQRDSTESQSGSNDQQAAGERTRPWPSLAVARSVAGMKITGVRMSKRRRQKQCETIFPVFICSVEHNLYRNGSWR